MIKPKKKKIEAFFYIKYVSVFIARKKRIYDIITSAEPAPSTESIVIGKEKSIWVFLVTKYYVGFKYNYNIIILPQKAL